MMVLATMMLPAVVTLIPTFVLFKELRWIDTWYPLIVPSFFGGGAFNVFLLRQFFLTIPVGSGRGGAHRTARAASASVQLVMPLSRRSGHHRRLEFMGDGTPSFVRSLHHHHAQQMIGVGLAFFRGVLGLLEVEPAHCCGNALLTIPVIILSS